ncbi:hypothetical protein Hsw_3827 [Hymenobacter swuensis DY53]|uniref:Uncharacterized protein n=1 Tax=Hymenobacter swuensis DY53 TaxID=1227739 RepID=W8F601_9BACT|nr:hypothetical protein Hsw_3827 [Hymenobacter swuensis DY53]
MILLSAGLIFPFADINASLIFIFLLLSLIAVALPDKTP